MHRLGLAVVLVAATVACERSQPSNPPEPTVSPEPADEPAPASETTPEVEPAPEPEPVPAQPEEPEVSEIEEAVFSKDGFEARDLKCTLTVPTRGAAGYIAAGLAEQDPALDACAPKGAAIEISWGYVSGQARNVSVSAETSKQANCIAAAMAKVRAGVEANCTAIMLLGDPAGATAAYDAR